MKQQLGGLYVEQQFVGGCKWISYSTRRNSNRAGFKEGMIHQSGCPLFATLTPSVPIHYTQEGVPSITT